MASLSSRSKGRPFRFAVLVVVLPLVLAIGASLASFPLEADDSTSGWPLALPFITLVVVFQIQMLSVTERFRTDVQRRAPLPLMVAAAGAAATIALFTLGAAATLPVQVFVGAIAATIAAAVSRLIVVRLLDPVRLPVATGPAPADALRGQVAPDRTPVWTGRAPQQPSKTLFRWSAFYLVFGIALLASTLTLDDSPPRGFIFVGVIVLTQVVMVPVKYRAARVRVSIGPAGLTVRSGLTRTEYLSIPLEHIDSAWFTDTPPPNLTTSWGKASNSRRLSYLTRGGPALLVRFTDGTDLVVSMDDPAEPAAVLNDLLDRRPAVTADETSAAC